MALFESNFYQSSQPQNSANSSTFFSSPYSQIPFSSNNIATTNIYHPHESIAMKRRRGQDEYEPSAKRQHYEERMVHRLNSLDLSNENPQQQNKSPSPPLFDIMDDNNIEINEIDPEILSDSPPQTYEEFDINPIIEEPDEDDRIILSDELHRYMKNANNDFNLLSKFSKKPKGNEIVLWRPVSDLTTSSSSENGAASSSSLNDRITEVVDDGNDEEEINDDNNDGIKNISDVFGQSHVTFPDESSSSNRSSSSPPQIIDYNDQFNFPSSSSSNSSYDGHRPIRMQPTSGFLIPQNQDYEPMEMD